MAEKQMWKEDEQIVATELQLRNWNWISNLKPEQVAGNEAQHQKSSREARKLVCGTMLAPRPKTPWT